MGINQENEGYGNFTANQFRQFSKFVSMVSCICFRQCALSKVKLIYMILNLAPPMCSSVYRTNRVKRIVSRLLGVCGGLEQIYFQSSLVFRCQHHSIADPYSFLYHLVEGQ